MEEENTGKKHSYYKKGKSNKSPENVIEDKPEVKAERADQQNLLDLVTLFVPHLDMQTTELLFRAIEPLLKDPNTTTQKKAMKVCTNTCTK